MPTPDYMKAMEQQAAEVRYLEAEELTEPGYYWWLPQYMRDEGLREQCWSIVSWHPANNQRERAGLFVGPLVAPVIEG